MTELLVFNPTTSASASFTSMEISTTTKLISVQAYSTNQKYVLNDNYEEGSSDNGINDDNEGNDDNDNDANEPAEKEQEAGGGGDSGVDSDTE